ncbi:MAG: ImmA/IrrE family metallo-endopeptidase [Planctomycetia bacterium]|nr:ImmA/IrrE family metallo-endopeptidase [Planctomycetia bacterium]
MLPEIPPEQLNTLLEELVVEHLALAVIHAPPVDAFALASSLGLIVARDASVAHRARLVRLNYQRGHSKTSILLAPEPRAERQQWSVAHEIGEHLASEACRRLGIRADELPPHGREQLANLLAGRMLLPATWFFADARRAGWDLISLKCLYATASHELIARRMLEGAIPIIIAVYDHDRLTWRKSNLPGRLPPPSPLQRDGRQAAHVTGESACDSDAQEDVQAWAIHEPEWKREIVRVELKGWE